MLSFCYIVATLEDESKFEENWVLIIMCYHWILEIEFTCDIWLSD